MRRATSRDEYEYYAKILHDEEYGRAMGMLDHYSVAPWNNLDANKQVAKAIRDPETPLSFLKNADKKLLLIGEIA